MPPDTRPFSEIEPRPIRWLWQQHIPTGMITALAGSPGVGKSLLSFRIAADVSQTHNVLISSVEERSHETARPRIDAAGANLARVHNFDPRLDALPKGYDRLAQAIVDHDARLVVLDPATMHIAAPPSNPGAIRAALDPLDRLCEETGCAVLIVAHQLKQVSPHTNPLMTVGGPAAGLVGLCRAVYLIGANPREPDELAMAPAKFNIGAWPPTLAFVKNAAGGFEDSEGPEAGFLELRGSCEVTAQSLVRHQYEDPNKEPVATKSERAVEWLSKYLWAAKQPVRPRDVVADAARLEPPITHRQLKRAASELGVNNSKSGQGAAWALTPELREMLDAQYEAESDGS
jgi:hypothetical protein